VGDSATERTADQGAGRLQPQVPAGRRPDRRRGRTRTASDRAHPPPDVQNYCAASRCGRSGSHRPLPAGHPVRIVVTLRDGRRVSRAQDDFHGAPSRPFTWERTAERFHWLTQPFADLRLRSAIIDAVDDLEARAGFGADRTTHRRWSARR
jgi:hypothetical protein